MTHVLDVAKYVLERLGPTTPSKLQKLVYYVQVWAIAEAGEPMFSDAIQAWAQGPVVPALFHEHKGSAELGALDVAGAGPGLSDSDRAHIDRVVEFYGSMPATYLSKLTRHERPWNDAHESGARQGHESPSISVDAIRAFYGDKSRGQLEADFQMHAARALMDEHAESLARLAL